MPNRSEIFKELDRLAKGAGADKRDLSTVWMGGDKGGGVCSYLNLLHQKTGRNVIAYYSGFLQRGWTTR